MISLLANGAVSLLLLLTLTASTPMLQEVPATTPAPAPTLPVTWEGIIATAVATYIVPKLPGLIGAVVDWIRSQVEKNKATTNEVVSGTEAFKNLFARMQTVENDNIILKNRVNVLEESDRRKDATIADLIAGKAAETARADTLEKQLVIQTDRADKATARVIELETLLVEARKPDNGKPA